MPRKETPTIMLAQPANTIWVGVSSRWMQAVVQVYRLLRSFNYIRLIIEIDALFLDYQRPVKNLGVDRPNVFTHDTQEH